jgi:hypothetical protein
VPYDDAALQRATALAEEMQADLGGTDILPVLQRVFATETALFRHLFVISDGEVSNTDGCVRAAAAHAAGNRISTLGVGSGADAGLINGLADATGGSAAFILDNEEIVDVVLRQLSAALSPRVSGVSVNIEGADALETASFPVPPLYDRQASVINVRTAGERQGASVLVSGAVGDGAHEIAVDCAAADCGGALRALYASEAIAALHNGAKDSAEVRARIVRESVESGVLSMHTSFIGVTDGATVDARPVSIKMPRPRPRADDYSDDEGGYPRIAQRCCYCAPPQRKADKVCPAPMRSPAPPRLQGSGSDYSDDAPAPRKAAKVCPAPMRSPAPPRLQGRDSHDSDYEGAPRKAPLHPPAPAHPQASDRNNSDDAPAPRKAPQACPAPAQRSAGADDLLLAIIKNQTANGSWRTLAGFAGVQLQVQVQVPDLSDLTAAHGEVATATLFAIALLRAKHSDKKSRWTLVEEKAISFLETLIDPSDIESLIAAIQSRLA